MNAQEYCELVEQKARQHKKFYLTIPIEEDNSPLVSLKNYGFNLVYEPSIKKDYKYFVREVVLEKIGRISKLLDSQDKRLIIRSVWRSFDHQRMLWENKVEFLKKKYPNQHIKEIRENVSYFIAPPGSSTHATGGAVDALIYDLKIDAVMDFGTNDGLKIDLTDQCYPYHPFISPLAKRNRKLLINLFEKEDFVCDLKEYWHFDYGNVSWAIEKGKKCAFYGIIKE
jgi:D-alanyl-D-alanine dipeptidase